MVGARRAGFTLVETMVSLAISSMIVILVGTVFLVQNEYYTGQMQRAAAQDNARSLTEVLASEIRSTMRGGVTLATKDSVTLRSPLVLGFVCARSGASAYVHFVGGVADLDTGEIAGVAMLNGTSGAWTYYVTSWSAINGGTELSIPQCVAAGADTTGIANEFYRLIAPSGYAYLVPQVGTLLMLFRETTYSFRTSVLDPTQVGLFRRPSGGSPVELVTGLDASASFRYHRRYSTSYFEQVSSYSTSDIDFVRVVAEASKPSQVGGVDAVQYGWSVNIPLRNMR